MSECVCVCVCVAMVKFRVSEASAFRAHSRELMKFVEIRGLSGREFFLFFLEDFSIFHVVKERVSDGVSVCACVAMVEF